MRAEQRRWPLIVFARSPVPGEVKTRLIPTLGVERATALHRHLLLCTLRRARAARGARVELWMAGLPDQRFAQACCEHVQAPFYQQCAGDLGERMARAFAQVLAQYHRAVLIGADCPAQTTQDLEQAAAGLETHDLVLQPAHDGGYVLIGLRRAHPELFEAIAWGSDRVLGQTLRRAAALGLSVLRLRALPDLDTEADLQLAREQGWIDA